jgi:UDP-glucuronate 4-epimerase
MTNNIKKIFVTGSAGFIGFSLCQKLLDRGDVIVGIDNHNSYYDTKIKDARIQNFRTLFKL